MDAESVTWSNWIFPESTGGMVSGSVVVTLEPKLIVVWPVLADVSELEVFDMRGINNVLSFTFLQAVKLSKTGRNIIMENRFIPFAQTSNLC